MKEFELSEWVVAATAALRYTIVATATAAAPA